MNDVLNSNYSTKLQDAALTISQLNTCRLYSDLSIYLTLGFLAPRLKISTSVRFFGMNFGGCGMPGLPLLDRASLGGGGEEPNCRGFGLEIMELMTSEGLGAGREVERGGDDE